MALLNRKSAIAAIEKHGILLVFPIDNKKEPSSLWSVFHPRTKMRWEWDSGGDNRVATLWYLKSELSLSRRVIYGKWYRGRATFFSKKVFTEFLAAFGSTKLDPKILSKEAREILELLKIDSPISTKQIKRASGLIGRALEPIYERALKELWQRMLIVAYGEVDDGAFPSLAIGSSQLLFENLWDDASLMDPNEAMQSLLKKFPANTAIGKQLLRSARP